MHEKTDPARTFDALFTAYHADVLSYIVRRTSLASAEDVLAETFLVAWRRADRVPKDPLRGYSVSPVGYWQISAAGSFDAVLWSAAWPACG